MDTSWIPGETALHMLMQRAIIAIGNATVSQWDGTEAVAASRPLPQPLPPQLSASQSAIVRATLALGKSLTFPPTSLSADEWVRADQIIKNSRCKAAKAQQRWKEACVEFHRAAVMGHIETFLHFEKSAALSPIQADVWAVVNTKNVFVHFTINLAEPSSNAFAGKGFHPVLVGRSSLNEFVTARKSFKANDLTQNFNDLTLQFEAQMGGAADVPDPGSPETIIRSAKPEANIHAEWWRGKTDAIISEAAAFLRADKTLTRAALLGVLGPKWPELTENFLRTRIWVAARTKAGLPSKGIPGKRASNPAA